MKHCNLLIDAAGSTTALSILKGIKKQKTYLCKCIMIDSGEFVAGKYLGDKFYRVPFSSDLGYIKSLVQICKKEHIDIFIPIIDRSFPSLVKNKQVFLKNGTNILLPGNPSINNCVDKYKTYLFFKNNDIPTPITYLTYTHAAVPKPLIIKTRKYGIASKNVFLIHDKYELEFYTKHRTNYLLQEFIDGREFTADCLSNINGSQFIAAIVRERIETKDGLSVKIKFIEKEITMKILPYIHKISGLLKLPGAYNIQGFISKNHIYFTEINPRFAGGHAFTIEAGLNSIKYIMDMFHGASATEVKKKIILNENLKMIRYWNEIFINDDKSWIDHSL